MDMSIRQKELKQILQKVSALLLDVRRKADCDPYPETTPGASSRNPEPVDAWSQEISKGKRRVMYGIG